MKSVILMENEGAEACKIVQKRSQHLQFKYVRLDTSEAVREQMISNEIFAYVLNASLVNGSILSYVVAQRKEFPDIPLIVLLSEGQNAHTMNLLQAGVRACLTYPLLYEDLSYQFSKIFADRTDTYNPFSVYFEERNIILPNDFGLVVQVVKDLVYATLPTEEKNKYQVILGLNEIINNAIEHGNLAITSEEKSEALKESRFFELAWIRSNQEKYKNRVVAITTRVYPANNRVEYVIRDEGDGFNWRDLPNPKDEVNILKRNGRGIMIAMHAFDEVHYNEKGNKATLVYNTHKIGDTKKADKK